VSYAYGGIPLLYMGDELALRNDSGYLADAALAPDNRWMHRPPMDWAAPIGGATRPPSKGGCSAGCAGWARSAGRCPPCTAG
jgi:hypothetical protein